MGYRPQIPVLSVLCPQLYLLNPPPEKNSWVRHCRVTTAWLESLTRSDLWVFLPSPLATGSPITIMCTACGTLAFLQLAHAVTFVHLALFLCSISVLPLKVIKRLAYGIDKDRVLCEVGAGLIMNVSLRRASGIRELPDGAK